MDRTGKLPRPDPRQNFRNSIWVTVKFTVITVVFEFLLGMIIALVVNSNFKGRGPMRAAMLVPWAIPTVVSAQMWKWMYNDIFGVFNDSLVTCISSTQLAWIVEPNTSLPAYRRRRHLEDNALRGAVAICGPAGDSKDVYEAANVDGANKIQQFFRITLPLLRPAILVTLIFRTLDSLRVFDVFFVMFGTARHTDDGDLRPGTDRQRLQDSVTARRQRRDLPDYRHLRGHLRHVPEGGRAVSTVSRGYYAGPAARARAAAAQQAHS